MDNFKKQDELLKNELEAAIADIQSHKLEVASRLKLIDTDRLGSYDQTTIEMAIRILDELQ